MNFPDRKDVNFHNRKEKNIYFPDFVKDKNARYKQNCSTTAVLCNEH